MKWVKRLEHHRWIFDPSYARRNWHQQDLIRDRIVFVRWNWCLSLFTSYQTAPGNQAKNHCLRLLIFLQVTKMIMFFFLRSHLAFGAYSVPMRPRNDRAFIQIQTATYSTQRLSGFVCYRQVSVYSNWVSPASEKRQTAYARALKISTAHPLHHRSVSIHIWCILHSLFVQSSVSMTTI
mgnify:CR=1 FL=1